MKTSIEKDIRAGKGVVHWTACEPFLENTRGVLIHRIRHVTAIKTGARWKTHLAVRCWCGNSMTGTKNFTFLSAPPDGKIVCARCEDAAIEAGLPTSDQLAGKHVHTGGVVVARRCCENSPVINTAGLSYAHQ